MIFGIPQIKQQYSSYILIADYYTNMKRKSYKHWRGTLKVQLENKKIGNKKGNKSIRCDYFYYLLIKKLFNRINIYSNQLIDI